MPSWSRLAAEAQLSGTHQFFTEFMLAQAGQGEFLGGALTSGTINANTVAAPEHPGCCAISSAASLNSGYRFVTNPAAIRFQGGEQFDMVFLTPSALSEVAYRFGFHDTINTAEPTDGAYFELISSGAIVGRTANNSDRDTTGTIVTLAVDTWYHARIRVNDAVSQVDFYIYSAAGTLLGSAALTTDIPSGASRYCGAGIVATTTGSSAIVLVTLDYMGVKFNKNLVRGALS